MARTKSNGNASEKSSATLRDALLPKLMSEEVSVAGAEKEVTA